MNVTKIVTSLVVAISTTFLLGQTASAANVKATPLGSQQGEFCQLDRAILFEDPDGTRLLYDPGRTVAGADDPRLGKIDVILVSHMHGDHVGDKHIASVGSDDCSKTSFPVASLPNTNTVNIALAKNAKIITGSEMPKFFGNKLKSLGGDPKHSQLVRFGAAKKVGGVTITTVPAAHSNGIAGSMIGGELGDLLNAAGLTAYAGPPTGYVLTFSNGLSVYLSGDTGITAEQDTVVRQHYNAKLAVINIGDNYTTGPTQAAWVINNLVKPTSVIASHANQPSTKNGQIIKGSKADIFSRASNVPVHLPLSGRTMSFDTTGKCVDGC
jgi:L-ascorbate metabolism protein UlaG (beta-lactamase superfamily)